VSLFRFPPYRVPGAYGGDRIFWPCFCGTFWPRRWPWEPKGFSFPWCSTSFRLRMCHCPAGVGAAPHHGHLPLGHLEDAEEGGRVRRWLAIAAFLLACGFLIMGALALRPFGKPARAEMDEYFNRFSQPEVAANNAVTAIVFDYRGYDTLARPPCCSWR